MSTVTPAVVEVFSAREIARAAGVRTADVFALLEAGRIQTADGRFVEPEEAIRAVRLLRGAPAPLTPQRALFRPPVKPHGSGGRPFIASAGLHGAMLALVVLVTMGVSGAPGPEAPPVHMVFIASPGPGGGGGGGGLRQPLPPPRAQLKDRSAVRSPVPLQRAIKVERPEPVRPPPPPPRPQPVPQPIEPPPPVQKAEPIPPVVAPVASASADTRDRPGVLADTAAESDSHGSGAGGGTGTGQGTGIGQGDGAGIGPGTGGGTGGGPYRPGSGITPPAVIREVKPDYTEEARRRGLVGDVVLEIVVRADGNVGQIRILQGLGAGLDQRAVDAVRQWRFSPARRHGTPVDVMVEVAVEFKLR